MTTLYGKEGVAVGTHEGDWLFDEAGKPIGTIIDGHVYWPPDMRRIGSFRGNILYDDEGHPVAVGPDPKLRMLARLEPRVGKMAERLIPMGTPVFDRGPKEIGPPFDQMSLVSSLVEFGRSQ